MRALVPPPRWPKAEASDIEDLLRDLEAASRGRDRLYRFLEAVLMAFILVMVRVALALGGLWPWPLLFPGSR